jgi:hypothetical protein
VIADGTRGNSRDGSGERALPSGVRAVVVLALAACAAGLPARGARAADRIRVELLPPPRDMLERDLKRIVGLRAEAERIRGLKLRVQPPWLRRTRTDVYRYYSRTISGRGREREVRLATALYAAFGFWGPDFDLVGVQLKAQTGAIGAFYVPEERSFTLVPQEGVRLNKFVQMEKDAQVVHEYVHALQDQHLNLSGLRMNAGNDRGSAVRALVEGDAVLAMSIFTVGRMQGRKNEKRLLPVTREMARRRAGMAQVLRMPDMKRAPPIVGVAMVFPYTGGARFVERAWRKGGWAEVNRCYRVPPISTEQVIHPEKYFRPRGEPIEDPVVISLPKVPAGVLPGRRLIDEDTLGEMEISVLLSGVVGGARARSAAAGWGGDRYAAYERTAGPRAESLVLCWLSVWDREMDAREFFAAYAQLLDGKCGVERKEVDGPAGGVGIGRARGGGSRRGRDLPAGRPDVEGRSPAPAAEVPARSGARREGCSGREEMSGDSGGERRDRSRSPHDEERILREEEEALLHDQDRQFFSRDTRGLPVKDVSGFCVNHPKRQAMAACAECGKLICGECFYASGGGHAFCRECMESSRLVDAEPQILGRFVEPTDNPPSPRNAVLAVIIVMFLLALLAAAFIAWGALSGAEGS